MKGLIVYFPLSGNTEKITETVVEVAEDSELIPVRGFQSSVLVNSDLFYIGYWADKEDCNAATLRLLAQLKDKRIALSGTLGAAKQTGYYDRVKRQVESHATHSHIFGHYLCQGAVGGAVITHYQSMFVEHPQDEHTKQQFANYESGNSHPDEQDLANARAFAKSIGRDTIHKGLPCLHPALSG